MNDGAKLIVELLTYIDQVERLRSRPCFTVPTDQFVAYQHELKGLPDLEFNCQANGDAIWLRVPKLHETAAPVPAEELSQWITEPGNPDEAPELKAELVLLDGGGEVSREPLSEHPQIKSAYADYIRDQWEPWAEAERPRRKTMARYSQLLCLQQTIASEEAQTPLELVWGMGLAVWKMEWYATAVRHPILTQSCEISLNKRTLDLEIRPRNVEPRLELACYADMAVPGLASLEAYAKNALSTSCTSVNPFEEPTFEGICIAAARYLGPNSAYVVCSDDGTLPAPSDTLKITNSWVLFARKRSSDVFLEDVHRVKRKVEETASLSTALHSLVEAGNPEMRVPVEQPFRGLCSSDSPAGAPDVYFPKPYNDEQLSIVSKLHSGDGVVVQGPPGTGKTHTIANVICHYLASGQRVLVTAKTQVALATLREQLPERIQPLSVALLSEEHEGIKQFERSIGEVTTILSAIDPASANDNIRKLELRLNDLHARISSVDRKISAYATKHLSNFSFRGRKVTPEDIAKLVVKQSEEHHWFDDEVPPTPSDSLPFDESHIAALRQARIKVGEDLAYLNCSLPGTDDFPPWPKLLGWHRDLVRAAVTEADIASEHVLAMVDAQSATFRKAQTLLQFLEERAALKAKIEASNRPWFATLFNRLVNVQPPDPALRALLHTCAYVQKLETRRRQLLAQSVVIPTRVELNREFVHAVERLAAGKNAFILPFGKAEVRKLLDAVRVHGKAPATTNDWRFVDLTLRWCNDARAALARWNVQAREFGLDLAGSRLESDFRTMLISQGHIEDLRRLALDFDAKLYAKIDEVLVRGTSSQSLTGGEAFISLAIKSLKEHIYRARLAHARRRIGELLRKLENYSGGIVIEIRIFLSLSLGRAGTDEALLRSTWVGLQAELARLSSLRPFFDQISFVSEKMRIAGAEKWAQRVEHQPAIADQDPVVPATWYKAWNWRRACIFLDRIDRHDELRSMFESRKGLTASLADTYRDLVVEKSWLGVFNGTPHEVQQAMQAYHDDVQPIGDGAGSWAIRHRKSARDAILRMHRGVPCWILPLWRVSEALPSDLGQFDLVVVDEASQADICALPALLRGKKILVFGDDKQVSPSSAGTAETKVAELAQRFFLANQPHGQQMTPDKSIYDLAQVAFAGHSVMLKEHFRCAPAIIEFSNRHFYSGDLKPLRLPKANERLDPPLVDVFVKGANRENDVNPAEAQAVVEQIQAILADPQLDTRSIGVVTLFGTDQAAHIRKLIGKCISPVDVVARKIIAGEAPAFQGSERDIMLVSMVLAPGDAALPNRPEIQQRFNVALTRARDRIYLFRSVADTAFDEASLNARVIRHFREQFIEEGQWLDSPGERCESEFERQMYDELVKRNYRVEPQVICGAYRIDLVVQGGQGRRLAIECDGDRFYGPAQWAHEMARQRVLERAGWTFWRCFASSFVRRREAVLADLVRTLDTMGIEPVTAQSFDRALWRDFGRIDPYRTLREAEAA